MSSKLTGVSIAVIGGDARELYLVPELLKLGAKVQVIGLPQLGQSPGLTKCSSLYDVVRGARFLILPMPGINQEGQVRAIYSREPLILNEEVMECISPEATVFVGTARKRLKELVAGRNIKLIELADMDEVAILNSIPSAEGAIQMAMEETIITIHGSSSLVLGFGRTGITLARMLYAIGAKVTVFARNSADLARAREMGFKPENYSNLKECIAEADVVYNTVPALVLDGEVLEHAKPSQVIIDLASAPGGTDFEKAAELGIKALLAPGLPGKVAPKTAGLILAQVIPRLIEQEITLTTTKARNGSGN